MGKNDSKSSHRYDKPLTWDCPEGSNCGLRVFFSHESPICMASNRDRLSQEFAGVNIIMNIVIKFASVIHAAGGGCNGRGEVTGTDGAGV